MTDTVSCWQSAIWLAIKRLQIMRYSFAVSPLMLLSTSSGVRDGTEAPAIYSLAAATASSEMRRLSVRI